MVEQFRELGNAYSQYQMYEPVEEIVNSILDFAYDPHNFGEVVKHTIRLRYVHGHDRLNGGPDGLLVSGAVAESFKQWNVLPQKGHQSPLDVGSAWSQSVVAFTFQPARFPGFKHTYTPDPRTSCPEQPSESSACSQESSGSAPAARSQPELVTKKPRSTRPGKQLCGYMTEMRSSLGNRAHLIGLTMNGESFSVSVADACGVITAAEVPYSLEKGGAIGDNLARIIIGLALSDPGTLGFDDRFGPPNGSDFTVPSTLNEWTYKVDDDISVTIEETMYVQWCPFGRGTAVYKVRDTQGEKRVLKIGRPYDCQLPEHILLAKASAALGDGAPIVYGHGSGELVSAGIRRMLAPYTPVPAEKDRRLQVLLMEVLLPLNKLSGPQYFDAWLDIVEAAEGT
ncbi:hypothetical protein BOTBODRAFT_255214 [Botryobasidium botryosum FD-172 SS1]|uniref:Fungal-type protein kinase domain-containing protein n=1 Tax=Botryobasidium botryosum (strain FD-172 SS1) TaxID=930990 RepID=A0A067M451_BOTB1|nr:hypothetical protein BOTBODRAFT_255214 [Botryobasidium botryosum FD-172 SS1]